MVWCLGGCAGCVRVVLHVYATCCVRCIATLVTMRRIHIGKCMTKSPMVYTDHCKAVVLNYCLVKYSHACASATPSHELARYVLAGDDMAAA